MSTVTSQLSSVGPLRTLVWRELVIILDNSHARGDEYMRIAREVNEYARTLRDGFGLIVVFPPLMKPPEPDVRQAIREAYALVGTQLRAAAWLIEGTDFRAAAVRAALAGLRMVMRLPFPATVTSSYEVAVPFVLERLSAPARKGVDARELCAGIKRDLALLSVQNV